MGELGEIQGSCGLRPDKQLVSSRGPKEKLLNTLVLHQYQVADSYKQSWLRGPVTCAVTWGPRLRKALSPSQKSP